MFANVFSCQMCSFGNQAKSTLNDCQHRPLRACRPVEDRIRSLPMTETSGVWAKRICRAVIGKRSKAKSVLGGDFFLFDTFSFWSHRKKKYIRRCKRQVYKKKWVKGIYFPGYSLALHVVRKRMNNRGCPGTIPVFCPRRKKKYIAYVNGKFTEPYGVHGPVPPSTISLQKITLFRKENERWVHKNKSPYTYNV